MTFSGDVAKWQKKTEQRIDKQVRAITLGLFRDVIMMSPVDTGRFRGNWNTSVGSPSLVTTPEVDPSGAKSIANAAANLGGAGTVTYMSNGLPYSIRLEYGWSKQAPAGFVRVNVARYAEMKVVDV